MTTRGSCVYLSVLLTRGVLIIHRIKAFTSNLDIVTTSTFFYFFYGTFVKLAAVAFAVAVLAVIGLVAVVTRVAWWGLVCCGVG